MDTKEFIEKANRKHNYKYDYSLSSYKTSKTKIKIICPVHGLFEQIPNNHLTGSGCKQCGLEELKERKTMSFEIFVEKANRKHNHKYDYISLNGGVAKIKCEKHGLFEQIASNHLRGQGCPKCSKYSITYTTESFIEKANEIFDNEYDYSFTEYVDAKTKIKIKCKQHGLFEKIPRFHLKGQGCPKCSSSKGEKEIEQILRENGIHYEKEKKFVECKDVSYLPFDFYLQDYNILIEFDGIQHFKPRSFFGGAENFEYTKKHDELKNKFAEKNGIKLIRISFKENIKEKLMEIFK